MIFLIMAKQTKEHVASLKNLEDQLKNAIENNDRVLAKNLQKVIKCIQDRKNGRNN